MLRSDAVYEGELGNGPMVLGPEISETWLIDDGDWTSGPSKSGEKADRGGSVSSLGGALGGGFASRGVSRGSGTAEWVEGSPEHV